MSIPEVVRFENACRFRAQVIQGAVVLAAWAAVVVKW